MPDYFAQALQQIRALAPDLLVVSGDLVDYPLDRLNDLATQVQGRHDLALVEALLHDFPAPVAVVPGNHDDLLAFSDFFGKDGEAQHPEYPSDQMVKGYRVLTFHDAEGPGNVPRRIGNQATRFNAALADTTTAPQIHIQHYLVWPERNAEYPHTYGEGAAMRDAITASGNVKLVLSGHYHTGVPPFNEKGTWFATVPAFAEPPHPFWLYELEGNQLTHHAFTLAT